MADNFTTDAPSVGDGKTFASDEIAGIDHPRVKVQIGADGAASDVHSGNPLPVSAASLPLPTGAATSANQSTIASTLSDIDAGKLEEATFTGRVGEVQATPTANTLLGRLKDITDTLAATLAISAASLPLPTGAATSANQGTANTALAAIQTAVEALVATWTPYKNLDIDEAKVQIKSSAGAIGYLHVMNKTNAPVYFKIWGLPSASVTVGTTEPTHTFMVPTLGDTNGAGFVLPIPQGGIDMASGITIACTLNEATSDATSPGASACTVNLGYQ